MKAGGMRGDGLADVVLLPKAIDNSQVVREVDPRASRDLMGLVVLVGVLVLGLVLHAWPHFELRRTAAASEQMRREKERLIEENRKLRLEKSSLENLRRVEVIAVHDLGLIKPATEQLVVVEVEQPKAPPEGTRLAGVKDAAPVSRN